MKIKDVIALLDMIEEGYRPEKSELDAAFIAIREEIISFSNKEALKTLKGLQQRVALILK